jgi:hypothetical protein
MRHFLPVANRNREKAPATRERDPSAWLGARNAFGLPAATAGIHAAARDGLEGPARELPHRGRLEASLRRDLGGVRAFVGGSAAAASRAIGASAYATGGAVAFREEPSLHTAAHEAAHVLQQQSGVQLRNGVGAAGDRYERQADAIADAVVAGRSAARLLPAPGARVGGAGSAWAVQRKEEGAAADDKKPSEAELKKEYESLTFKRAIAGDFEGFKEMRDSLLAEFGTLAAANTYYAGVRPHQFLGFSTPVHVATMGAKLDATEKFLRAKKTVNEAGSETSWYDDVIAGNPRAGGFNIRRNRNNPKELSDHSFGWAIDIASTLNPNIKQFPAAAVLGLTGEGLFTGATEQAMRAGGSVDAMTEAAAKLRAASDTFKADFADEDSFETAMVDYLNDKLGLDIDEGDFDLDLVKAASKQGGKKGAAAFDKLVALLLDSLDDDAMDQATAEQAAEEREAIASDKEKRKAAKKAERKAEKAAKKAAKKNAKAAPAAAQSKVEGADAGGGENAAAPDQAAAAEKKKTEAKHSIAVTAAHFLVGLWNIFVSSFADQKRTKRKAPVAVGATAGTIAASGFISLDPKLIGALTGNDGGNLDWLGLAEGTKDFMHFQLKRGDRPPLK